MKRQVLSVVNRFCSWVQNSGRFGVRGFKTVRILSEKNLFCTSSTESPISHRAFFMIQSYDWGHLLIFYERVNADEKKLYSA